MGAAAGYNWDLIKEKLGMATKDSGVQVTDNATEAGRAQNRRVEMVIRPLKS